MKTLEQNTVGAGDRFAHQAGAQLAACLKARDQGATVVPVWNKSNREHDIIGSEPDSVLAAAGWDQAHYVDADHIAHAVKTYGLPANLKLSVHSGSDKFSLYPVMRETLSRRDAGAHLKTAGTTWLEELIARNVTANLSIVTSNRCSSGRGGMRGFIQLIGEPSVARQPRRHQCESTNRVGQASCRSSNSRRFSHRPEVSASTAYRTDEESSIIQVTGWKPVLR